jgi:hypothetical protein
MPERRTARSRQEDDEPVASDEAMADDKPTARKRRAAEASEPEPDEMHDESARSHESPNGHDAGLSAAQAAKTGLRQLIELTGKDPEGVTGVELSEEGWVIGVEVVEDRRVPSSADILATYEAELDTEGELVSYRRVRRYPRGRGDQGEGS